MTHEEWQVVEDMKILNYMFAVKNRKAHCGRLPECSRLLEAVVAMDQNGQLQMQHHSDEPPIFTNALGTVMRLPSHQEVVTGVLERQAAKDMEQTRYVDAFNAGVDSFSANGDPVMLMR